VARGAVIVVPGDQMAVLKATLKTGRLPDETGAVRSDPY